MRYSNGPTRLRDNDKYYVISVDNQTSEAYYKLCGWCQEYDSNGEWYVIQDSWNQSFFFFSEEKDAMVFVLRWA